MNFERFFYEILTNVTRYIESRPLHLGGSSGASGGEGGRPGGYVGYLPQTRVAYDTTEAATLATSGSPSLVDNLNHIRYRIQDLESTITVSGLTIEKDNVPIVSNIRTIDFRGGVIVEDGGNYSANVFITLSGFGESIYVPSGVYNVNLSNQITGNTATFTLPETAIPNSIQVYLNGLQQVPVSVTNNSFTLDFTPVTGDILYVNYDKLVGLAPAISLSHHSLFDLDLDDHPQYLNNQRALQAFYTKEEIDLMVAPIATLSGLLTLQRGSLIAGGVNNNYQTISPPTSGGQILIADFSEDTYIRWGSLDINQLTKKQIRQQIVFTVAGRNLGDTRVIPIRFYVHQLGDNPKIENILAFVGTAPMLNNLRLKVLRNGVNIFSTINYLEIPIGQNLKSENTGFNDAISSNDYFQLEIVQGDSFAADLTLHIRFVSEV